MRFISKFKADSTLENHYNSPYQQEEKLYNHFNKFRNKQKSQHISPNKNYIITLISAETNKKANS